MTRERLTRRAEPDFSVSTGLPFNVTFEALKGTGNVRFFMGASKWIVTLVDTSQVPLLETVAKILTAGA